jgi:hypothetical protein
MDGLDTMSDLLASLPGLGSVGGPGPLSREADERTFESALDALARAAGWPCEVRWALLALLWQCDFFGSIEGFFCCITCMEAIGA